MNRPLRLAVLVTMGLCVPLAADAKLARTGTPAVAFHARGPAGMHLTGTTSDLDVIDQGATVTIRVPLAHLATGIGLRDHHMREKYLEVGKYPNADLVVDRASVKTEGSGDAQGTMTIHGKSKRVSFHYAAHHAGGKVDVTGRAHIDFRDFGIKVPSYLGVTVKPDIDIDVHFAATE